MILLGSVILPKTLRNGVSAIVAASHLGHFEVVETSLDLDAWDWMQGEVSK